MDNRNIFDPYAQFGVQNNIPPAYTPPLPNNDFIGPAMSFKEFYEQQEVYYRYLTTMMEYNLKSREYEKLMRQDKSKNIPQ